jgi:hypothetical protein
MGVIMVTMAQSVSNLASVFRQILPELKYELSDKDFLAFGKPPQKLKSLYSQTSNNVDIIIVVSKAKS